jgi:hypothetical protein
MIDHCETNGQSRTPTMRCSAPLLLKKQSALEKVIYKRVQNPGAKLPGGVKGCHVTPPVFRNSMFFSKLIRFFKAEFAKPAMQLTGYIRTFNWQ